MYLPKAFHKAVTSVTCLFRKSDIAPLLKVLQTVHKVKSKHFCISIFPFSTPPRLMSSFILQRSLSTLTCPWNSHCTQGRCPGTEIIPSQSYKPIPLCQTLTVRASFGVSLSHRSQSGPRTREMWGKPIGGAPGKFFSFLIKGEQPLLAQPRLLSGVNVHSKRTKSLFTLCRDASQGHNRNSKTILL